MKSRILILTYYWPPAGGPGVQRWLKFVKYLPEFGWDPTVYIPENPSYPILDETLLKDVPDGLSVLKKAIIEPYALGEKFNSKNKKFKAGQFDTAENQSWLSKLSIWIRGNFFIPDARVLWVRPSVNFLCNYLRENPTDILVTTGPPHSVHLTGLRLKKKFPNLKWVADFRDPWTEISYYKHLKLTKAADRLHRKQEKTVFQTADLCLATSYTDAENFRKKGANALCITNGFDEEDILPSTEKSSHFVLNYTGVLEQLRNPAILWESLGEIYHRDKEFKNDFRLRMAGRIDEKILEQINHAGLSPALENLGYINHSLALEEMNRATLLLLTNFPNEESRGIIPGKLFEYLATGNAILSFGPENSDVAKILETTQAGEHFSYTDKQRLTQFLLKAYQDWKNGTHRENHRDISAFSRRNLTAALSEALRKISVSKIQ